jgi:hypothetical protein
LLETSEDLIGATDGEGRLTVVSPSWTRHWDGDLRCLEANRAACEGLGYTRDEMLSA